MKLTARSLLSLTALVLCAARLAAADAVELRQQWQVGKKYTQVMDMAQISSFTVGEQKIEQKMNMTAEVSTAVKQHEDGKQKRLTAKYDRVTMKIVMNGQESGFDSAKPDSDAIGVGKVFAAMTGRDLKLVANEKDEITGIENFDEFVAAAGGGAAGPQLAQFFNKDSLTEMLKQGALKAMPGKPVNPGDSWPFGSNTKMPPIGQIAIKGTYTFKGMAPHGGIPCAEIAVDANMNIDFTAQAPGDAKPDGPAAALAALGMKMTGGKLAGTVWFDPALGMARDSEFSQEMAITMKNPAQPDATMTIPMKQIITQKLTKVEDVK